MEWLRKKWFLYFSACSVNFISIVIAIGAAWTSPYIPKLQDGDDPDNPLKRPIDTLEVSWITSLQGAGAIFGPVFTGYVANKIGKKRTILLFSIPALVSNVMLIFANTVVEFYIARFLLGLSTGPVYSVVPIYVAEISTLEDRGPTSIFLIMFMSGSYLFTYSIGPYVSIPVVAIISVVIAVLFFITFGVFVPESPFYFVAKNDVKSAENALRNLRRTDDVKVELSQIIKTAEESVKEESIFKMLDNRLVKKCLVISIGMLVFLQLGGVAAVTAYQQTIFDSANTAISGDKSTIVSGSIQLLTNMLVTQIVNLMARKKLLLYSMVGNLLSLITLGVYFLFQENNYDMDKVSWLPIVGVCFYIFCFNIGIGPISFTILGEIFPSNVKSHLSAISTFLMLCVGFLMSFLFPLMRDNLGTAWTFLIYAIFVLCDVIFTITLVPETKDKTFLEIEEMLK